MDAIFGRSALSHSPANAGQEWKLTSTGNEYRVPQGHSPANAGQEWKQRLGRADSGRTPERRGASRFPLAELGPRIVDAQTHLGAYCRLSTKRSGALSRASSLAANETRVRLSSAARRRQGGRTVRRACGTR